ncbi:BrnA antitoxin family protein [Bosea sp. RAF48]|uniref:BrnA antitoxin family protein n=1 Tax=Bosea sp. RAF48 TaxID=3237480 RepID=UPI003F8EBA02
MSNDRTRRPTSARDKAEALFAAPKVAPPTPIAKRTVLPGAKEMVTLRIDSEVLAHFQDGGPGWQDRINDALRKAMPAALDEGLRPNEFNSSNDG